MGVQSGQGREMCQIPCYVLHMHSVIILPREPLSSWFFPLLVPCLPESKIQRSEKVVMELRFQSGQGDS